MHAAMNDNIRILDLFSGIGGFSHGFEKHGGFETVAFCEQDEFADAVLEKHWPDVISYDDVKTITRERLEEDDITEIDLICGGFPCQDISLAGKGAGLKGERSGLWAEYARIIGEVGPRWVVIENVSALRSRGFVTVLQNLSALGYDAEWHCIPASYVGAPHQRDRIWIIAYANSSSRWWREKRGAGGNGQPTLDGAEGPLADTDGTGREEQRGAVAAQTQLAAAERGGDELADTTGERRREARRDSERRALRSSGGGAALADAPRELRDGAGFAGSRRRVEHTDGSSGSGNLDDAGGARLDGGRSRSRRQIRNQTRRSQPERRCREERRRQSRAQSEVGLLAYGLPAGLSGWGGEPEGIPRVTTDKVERVSKLKCLGNSIVPQIIEYLIAPAIYEAHHADPIY